jgi:predicted lipoprotein with Yx(FWY)xxD motif
MHPHLTTRIRLVVALSAAGLAISACGSDPAANPAPAAAPVSTVAPVAPIAPVAPVATSVVPVAVATPGATVVVKGANSTFGQILVDADGNTLYAFLNDTNFTSTCSGTCAEAWPPAMVDASWSVAPGLDAGVFSTVVRPEGGEQLMAGRYPLYRFAGDARPGDITGQGSGGVWFVVGTDAVPIEDDTSLTDATEEKPAVTDAAAETTAAPAPAAPPVVATGETSLGHALVDASGLTLYGFVPDKGAAAPTCVDGCAQAWPPLIVDGNAPELGDLAGSGIFTVVQRADGSLQLQAGAWPLYTFAGDAAPGDITGQGSGGKWFVVAPDGTLIK